MDGRRLAAASFIAGAACLVGVALGVSPSNDRPGSRETSASAVLVGLRHNADRPPRTIYDVFPVLCESVQPENAPATARTLRGDGFAVTYVLLDPGVPPGSRGTRVNQPPPGTVVISVLDADGSYSGIRTRTRRLLVEVATDPGIEPVGRDGACPSRNRKRQRYE